MIDLPRHLTTYINHIITNNSCKSLIKLGNIYYSYYNIVVNLFQKFPLDNIGSTVIKLNRLIGIDLKIKIKYLVVEL